MLPWYVKKIRKKDNDDGCSPFPKQKRKPDLVKKLDKVFSLYIRVRDAMPGGYFRCISCGQIKPFYKADCGHYFSRTNMSVRFDEDNCNAECSSCNRMKSDHLDGYRGNLISKIGQKRFDLLQFKKNQTKHWSDFELEELIKLYKEKARVLKQQKGL